MTQVEILDAAHDGTGGFKVDVSRGDRVGRVSSEWLSRPADARYLSLPDLFAAVRGRTERSRTRTVESAAIRVELRRHCASSSVAQRRHWRVRPRGILVVSCSKRKGGDLEVAVSNL